MAIRLRYAHVIENGVWPKHVPTDPEELLAVQSMDALTGVDVWWLEVDEDGT